MITNNERERVYIYTRLEPNRKITKGACVYI